MVFGRMRGESFRRVGVFVDDIKKGAKIKSRARWVRERGKGVFEEDDVPRDVWELL
jgi:hypothetical protein